MIDRPSSISLSQGDRKAERLIRCVIVAVVLFFSAYRLFLGVDFTDEAYYTAVAYRFVLGDRPFVDQILVHQTAFYLFTPLVGLFHWVTGGTDGIVLFLRIMTLAFSTCVAAVVYRVLRCGFERNISLLASLFCIAFSGEWVTFCYNNLGALFLLVGLMLEFRAIVEVNDRHSLIIMGLAGLSSGFACVSYPPLILSVGVSVVVALAYLASPRLRMLGAFVAGFTVATMPIAALAWSAGWGNLISFIKASANISAEVGQGGGSGKVLRIWNDLKNICFPNQLVEAATVLVAGLAVLFRHKTLRVVLASIVFLPLVGLYLGRWGASFSFLIKFCLWSPLLFVLLNNKSVLTRRLFWCVCFPSFIAGLTTAWTSANGGVNAGVGLIPAVVVTMVMLALTVEEALSASNICSKLASAAVMASVLLTIVTFQFRFIYGEGMPNGLTARVDRGPYWGLATTEIKAALSHALFEDLKKYDHGQRILFYDFFPAGYLFGGSRPASNTTWEYRSTRSGIMGYFGDSAHLPETVFEMKAMYGHRGCMQYLSYSIDDPLVAYLRCHYQLVCDKSFYRIYSKRQTPAGLPGEMAGPRGAEDTTLFQGAAR